MSKATQSTARRAVTAPRVRRVGLLLAASATLSVGGLAESAEDRRDEAAAGGADAAPAPGEEAAEERVEEAVSSPSFRLALTAGAWFGSLDGYLQTSRGGQAGTTDYERPELEEVGLDGLQVLPTADLRITLFGEHEAVVDWAGIDIDGNDVLDLPLTSQGVTFPAGSAVESGLELHMIRVGYRAGWLLPSLGEWRILPEVGVSIDPFSYTLTSPTVPGEVDRSYNVAFPYVGVLVEGPIWHALRGEVELAGMGGINGATLVDADVRVIYPLLDEGGIAVSGVVGLRGTWFRRRDYQSPLYNEIDLRIGAFSTTPWAGVHAGLRVEF